MPKLTKRGPFWHYTFNVEGERFRFSARTSDKELATDIAVKHENRARRAAVHGPEAVTTFAEAVGAYIDAGKDTRYVLKALDHFKEMKLSLITPPMIREAAEKLNKGCSNATKNRQGIAPIQAIINFAAEQGKCAKVAVRRFPVDRVARPPGNKHWIAAFQRTARARGNEHVASIARFMFETGARIGQATALQWDDIDLQEGTAVLRTGKTGRNGAKSTERTAWLTPAMVAEIANFKAKHPIKVFGYSSRRTIYRAWWGVVAAAKLKPLTPHEAGRHGFGTEMVVRAGVDVATAAEAGGWKSKRLMLDTYVHGDTARSIINEVFGTSGAQRRRKR